MDARRPNDLELLERVEGRESSFTVSPSRLGSIPILVFASLWDSFFVMLWTGLTRVHAPQRAFLVPIVHALLGVVVTWVALVRCLNVSRIALDPNELVVRHGPIPARGARPDRKHSALRNRRGARRAIPDQVGARGAHRGSAGEPRSRARRARSSLVRRGSAERCARGGARGDDARLVSSVAEGDSRCNLRYSALTMSTAWLFPGQGAQSVGMAKDVLAVSAAAREIFARADEALGEPLSRLILEGPEEALTLTANAQPAIVTTSCAILAAIRERAPSLPSPAFGAGHSLGEYSALVASGALSLEDAVRIVRARGRSMQEAVSSGTGAMAAVMGIEPAKLVELCKQAAQGEIVSPANFNAPGQIVVAGHAGAVARVSELVAAEKGKAIALKVSAPFHCALMAPAARALAETLGAITVKPLAFPIVANFDAKPNGDAARVKELLVGQVDGAVRWEESVRFIAGAGVDRALEIGPGKVLAGLVRRIAKDVRVLSVGDVAGLDQVAGFFA